MVETPSSGLKLLPAMSATRKHSLGQQQQDRLKPPPAGRKLSLDPLLLQPRDISQLIGTARRPPPLKKVLAHLPEEEGKLAGSGEVPRPLPLPAAGPLVPVGSESAETARRKAKGGKAKKGQKGVEPERGIFDDLLLPTTSPASSSTSSGYHSIKSVSTIGGGTSAAAAAGSSTGGKAGGGNSGLLFTRFLPPGAARAAGLQSFAPTPEESEEEEDSDSDDDEDEDGKDEDVQLQGELAIDLFIDPFNPTGKAAHSSLTSKIRQQEQAKELRTEESRRRQTEEKERIKLEKECGGLNCLCST